MGEEVIKCLAMKRHLQITVYSITKDKGDETLSGCKLSHYGLEVGAGSASRVYSIVYDPINKHYSALKVESCGECKKPRYLIPKKFRNKCIVCSSCTILEQNIDNYACPDCMAK